MRPRPLILVVDDEKSLVTIVQRVLIKEGFDVITAFNGNEALEQAREHLPDVIVLDIVMPGMSGYKVCQELQKETKTADIPVIILSVKGTVAENKGSPSEKLKEISEAFDCVASDFLNKPVTARELIDTIHKALSFNRILSV